MSGFYGADLSNRADTRALDLASNVLSTRMVKQIREDAQLVYSIGASSRAGSTFPGFGVFSAGAPTEPHKVEALVAKLASMYEAFAKDGPTEDELAVVRKQSANNFDEQTKEPGYWMARIEQMTFRGIALDDVAADPAAYQALTAKQVKEAFAKYWSKENSIVVVVKPKNAPPPPEKPSTPAGK
jgi:zinc protease